MSEQERIQTSHPRRDESKNGQTPTSVIRSYLVITGLYTLSASLIWGINTLLLLGAGLDIFEVFIANGVYTASMVIFEIPTGVWADSRGRRSSFLLTGISISSFLFTRKAMPRTLSCQPQTALASLRW